MPPVTDPSILEQLNSGQAQQAPATYPGVIRGAPDPADDIAQRNANRSDAQFNYTIQRDAAKDAQDAEERQREAAERADAERIASSAVDDAKYQIGNVINAARQAREKSNEWFATGFGASTASGVGGSSASDVQALLNTIGANTAFDRLQKMREESPTGGALGAVSEIELRLLRDSIASIDQSQSDEQFQENMRLVEDSYQRVLDRLEGRAVNLTKDESDRVVAFWNSPEASRMSPDAIKRWYSDAGIDAPSDEDIVASISKARAGQQFSPLPPREPTQTSQGESPYSLGNITTSLAQGAGSMVSGLGDLLGVAVNPVGQGLYNAMGINETYDTGKILREGAGLPENPNQLNDTVIRNATGAFAGAGAGKAAVGLATSPAIRNSLATIGRTPIRDTVAGAGAGAGMVAAKDQGPLAQAGAGILGGVVGYGGANALAQVGQARIPNALMQNADRLGVKMLPADVGGTATRMATGGVGRTLGGIPLADAAQEAVGTAATVRTNIARQIGSATDDAGAGQAVRRGLREFDNSSAERAGELYSQVSVPPESAVTLNGTRDALSEITRGFRSNPEMSQLWVNHPRLRATLEALTPEDVAEPARKKFMRISDELSEAQLKYSNMRASTNSPPNQLVAALENVNTLKQELQRAQRQSTRAPVGGEMSWEDMSRFRSIVGEIVGRPGVSADGSDISALRKLYGAISEDMEVTAASTSPRALQQFRRATQYWRGRESRLEDVFSSLLGEHNDRSPEMVLRQINNWAKKEGGDFSRLARTIRSLPDDEADTVRSTLVQRMGMATPANQSGAAGEVFSPGVFSTQWQGMSQRAKAVLFPNKQHRQDIDSFAELMGGMKGATKYQNFSNTSLGVNVTAQGALALTNLPVAAGLASLQFGAGKLLASPRFARIIASTSRMPAERQGRALKEQLGVLATRQPSMNGDIQGFLRAMNDNPAGQLAAEDQPTESR